MRCRIGEYTLDMGRFELCRGDEAVQLEPQVLRLVAHLVSRRGELVTRDELIETVWEGRIVSDTAISSRIKSARAALGDNGDEQRLIKTVHGRGFRFVGEVEGLLPASAATPDAAAPVARPSIAVLPFQLLGDPGEWRILAEALPHDLIIELSRLRWLHVIARGSSFRLLPEADPREVGQLLSVRYAVSGSIEQLGNRIAVSVQLSDTQSNGVIWGERFEGARDEIHDIRARIALGVTMATELRIPQNEALAARVVTPENLDAWQAYHLGLQHMFRFNAADNEVAARLFETALVREPSFARAHAGLSFTSFQTAFLHYSADGDAARFLAREQAEQAVSLDPLDPFVNFSMGRSYWLEGKLENSLSWLDRATTLSPNYAQGIYATAWARAMMCDGVGGLANADRAMSLSPIDPLFYAMMATRAMSHMVQDEMPEAADWAERAAVAPGAHVLIKMIAASVHVLNGDEAQAQRWVGEVRQAGRITVEDFFQSFPLPDGPVRLRLEAAIRGLGF